MPDNTPTTFIVGTDNRSAIDEISVILDYLPKEYAFAFACVDRDAKKALAKKIEGIKSRINTIDNNNELLNSLKKIAEKKKLDEDYLLLLFDSYYFSVNPSPNNLIAAFKNGLTDDDKKQILSDSLANDNLNGITLAIDVLDYEPDDSLTPYWSRLLNKAIIEQDFDKINLVATLYKKYNLGSINIPEINDIYPKKILNALDNLTKIKNAQKNRPTWDEENFWAIVASTAMVAYAIGAIAAIIICKTLEAGLTKAAIHAMSNVLVGIIVGNLFGGLIAGGLIAAGVYLAVHGIQCAVAYFERKEALDAIKIEHEVELSVPNTHNLVTDALLLQPPQPSNHVVAAKDAAAAPNNQPLLQENKEVDEEKPNFGFRP